MAKGAYLTPRIKNLIAKIYLENHRRIGPTKAREELLRKMKEEELDKIFGPDFPSVSSVSLQLKKCTKYDEERLPESKRLDEPWSTVTLVKYPIPPEALLSVLRAWVYTSEKLNDIFTVRQALWVARFYGLTEDITTLTLYSRMHAFTEKMYEISGEEYAALGLHQVDLQLFKEATGEKVTRQRRERILRVLPNWAKIKEIDEESIKVAKGTKWEEASEMVLGRKETIQDTNKEAQNER